MAKKEGGAYMNKYIIPFILLSLGLIMSSNLFSQIDEFVVACFNLCAFSFTLSCINVGSVKSKRKAYISYLIRTTLQTMGIIALLLIIIDQQFKYYIEIYNFITGLNPNSLLLIGLAATLFSIYAGQDYNLNKEKSYENEIRDLKNDVHTLKNHYLDQKEKNITLKSEKEKLSIEKRKLEETLKEVLDTIDKKNY